MIKAQDLRIGNILMRKNKFDGKPRVTRIIGMMVFQAEREPDEFEPIALTSEILEKCGFEKCDTDSELFTFDAENIRFPVRFHHRGINGYSLTDPHHSVILSEPIKFLHQLQNLIYALTGTELTVKL